MRISDLPASMTEAEARTAISRALMAKVQGSLGRIRTFATGTGFTNKVQAQTNTAHLREEVATLAGLLCDWEQL